MNCRHCESPLQNTFLDLGFSPPSNAYLNTTQLQMSELYFPLKLQVCTDCWLVQTEDYTQADELFSNDYAYFSSVSKSWLVHANKYANNISKKLSLNGSSFVIEIASNDGYLLKNFISMNIPCLGIEPTKSTADAAEALGIPVLREFFGTSLAQTLANDDKKADLICGNNVYAHVPDINDFTEGLKIALKPNGTITLEFPHLMRLLESTQFDTVYHEHFSYLSLNSVIQVFSKAGLRVYDVEELSTHGGSLRIYGCHMTDIREETVNVSKLISEEKKQGMLELSTYLKFQPKADKVKDDLLYFLLEKKKSGKKVAAYGAAAKGNTLLNYAGVKPDLLRYVCDSGTSKQGKYLPGSHIPILSPEVLKEDKPDIVLILPWNIADEVISEHDYIQDWGGEFYVAVPSLRKIS